MNPILKNKLSSYKISTTLRDFFYKKKYSSGIGLRLEAKRFYSTKSDNNLKNSNDNIIKPTPIFVLKNLDNINLCKELLKNKGGIYSFINTINGKQYIGSAKDFYLSASHKRTFK